MGWIKSAHGIRGENYVQLYADQADWLDEADRLHLLRPGAKDLTAHKLQKKTPHKEGLIVKFTDSPDRNYAETLAKSGVYIPTEWLVAEDGDAFFLKQIENFELLDPEKKSLGRISGFSTNGVQDLLIVQRTDGLGEVLVPLVEAFLVTIDFEGKTVTMDLPEGLFDLD